VTADAGSFAAGIDRDARRTLVAATAEPALDGIDFVEVLSNQPGTRDYVPGAVRQRTLLVHLLKGPVPTDLRASRVAVLGGVRPDPLVNPVRVEWAYPASDLAGTAVGASADPLPGVTEPDRDLVRAAAPVSARERVLAVRTSSSGDWSTYLLRLLGSDGTGVPSGFDQPLAQAPFSFTVDCPSGLDCRPTAEAAPGAGGSPLQDYLARDFAALQTRLSDRLGTLLPDWTDGSPADLGVTLTELFAYLGDRLAYWQDAAGTEAYLGTARRRTSVRRHARLLDYRMHEGCSARTWLVFTTPATLTLAAGTVVSSAASPGEPALDVATAGGTVFATCAQVTLRPERDRLLLHSWGDPGHCLPAGSTSAFVTASADPMLARGDVIVLTGFDPGATPLPVPDGGDPALRYAVRLDRDPAVHTDPLASTPAVYELHWFAADALPSALPVTRPASDGSPEVIAVAWANVVLADHGATVDGETLDPAQVPAAGFYAPRLRRRGLTWAQPYDTAAAAGQAAALALQPDPRLALAQVELNDGLRAWQPRPDLLASTGLDPHFVVEPEDDGTSRIRFGDGILGRAPTPAATLQASYRIGGGEAGNVAAGVLTNLVPAPGVDGLGDVTVSNPRPATGGQDPQPLAEVRELAPHAFRTQLRAVTPQDYAAVAMENPGVQRAVARRRWAGSWYAVQATIDPLAAYADDADVPGDVGAVLEVRRLAGVDAEVARPVYVPLDIVLTVCVAAGYQRADVAAQLRRALSAQTLPDGRRGFFHPDNFTFGQPLYLSDLVAAVMAVPGVAWVQPPPNRFAPLGRPPGGEATAGVIGAAPREVLRADSDPSNPENGRVEILLRGGS
jgi:baseplate J-like protein